MAMKEKCRVHTTTWRVTAMRDCLISCFTAGVHLVLIGSPGKVPQQLNELEDCGLFCKPKYKAYSMCHDAIKRVPNSQQMPTCQIDDNCGALHSLVPPLWPIHFHPWVRELSCRCPRIPGEHSDGMALGSQLADQPRSHKTSRPCIRSLTLSQPALHVCLRQH